MRIVCSIEGTQFNKTRHKYWAKDTDGDYFLLLRRLKKERETAHERFVHKQAVNEVN